MPFDNKQLHLVPPCVQDRATNLINERRPEIAENYAQQLEAIRDYCMMALELYARNKKR